MARGLSGHWGGTKNALNRKRKKELFVCEEGGYQKGDKQVERVKGLKGNLKKEGKRAKNLSTTKQKKRGEEYLIFEKKKRGPTSREKMGVPWSITKAGRGSRASRGSGGQRKEQMKNTKKISTKKQQNKQNNRTTRGKPGHTKKRTIQNDSKRNWWTKLEDERRGEEE